ncbi:MAG TPA: LLM class flavin-dependent oxidoreductase [Thermoplasmata archaeon]|nr:LLM class flavin-dependent oxidoreductase [Thermoplasmata archaeon]
MRLSAFSVVDVAPGAEGRAADRLLEVLGLGEAAEAAGLDAVWVAEHHFHDGGVCPSPPVLLAALAARTRRIAVGSMVSVLPFHDPIDLAEQYAMVDRISGGRLRLGVGSGYIPLEFEGFGVDPAVKRERFDRNLATLLAAFGGEEVRAEVGSARPVRTNVRPVQRPHPPLWVAAQRREAIPFVARRGASLALIPYATVADLAELKDEIQEFHDHRPAGGSGEVAAAVHIYAGEHVDRARAAFQRYLDARLATQSTFYQEKVARHPHAASARALEDAGFAYLGSPAEVETGLQQFADAGVDEVLGIFDFGGLSADEVARSVTALGRAWGAAGR